MSSTPDCRLVADSARFSDVDIVDLRYDTRDLTVTITSPAGLARVLFPMPIGFRVLDEGDITEFWPRYSSDKGWLWEVLGGGWLDLERQRALFLSGRLDLREFLLTSDGDCISVLVGSPPEIIDGPG